MTGLASASHVSVLTYVTYVAIMFNRLTRNGPASGGSTTTILTTTTKTATTTKAIVISARGTGFPATNGLDFEIDGKKSYFAGSNSYWIGFLTNNDDVDLVLDHMDESGLRILRVWGFNDVNTVPSSGTVYYQLLTDGNATINTGADGLQRLDLSLIHI